MKYLKKLSELLLSNINLSYNDDAKKEFKKVDKKAMKELATILKLKKIDVYFNPGGIAVSGDLHLMGMWNNDTGIYISMNKDFPTASWGQVLYRTIKHMKDYTGGTNNYLNYEDLASEEKLKEMILRLKS